MQFESKITPNVIAKDEVLKQSQNKFKTSLAVSRGDFFGFLSAVLAQAGALQ